MNPDCLRPEDLETIDELPPGDPRRAHAGTCPRCSSLLASYREFVKPGAPPAGADTESANLRLRASLREEIFEKDPRTSSEAGRSGSTGRQRGGSSWSFLSSRAGWSAWRPALGALAGILLIVTVVEVARYRSDSERPIVPRGRIEDALPAAAAVEAGTLRFHWRAEPDADRYELRFFRRNLEEISRISLSGDTALVLPPAELARLGPSGSAVLWQAVALRGADELRESRPRPVLLP